MVLMSKIADTVYFVSAVALAWFLWKELPVLEMAIQDITWIISNL